MSLKRLVLVRASLFVAALILAVPAFSSGSSAQRQSSAAPLSLKASAQAAPVSPANAARVASTATNGTVQHTINVSLLLQ